MRCIKGLKGRTAACLPCQRSNCADQELLGPGAQMFNVFQTTSKEIESSGWRSSPCFWCQRENSMFLGTTSPTNAQQRRAIPTQLRLLKCTRMLMV